MLECIIRDDACIDRSQCTFENVLYDERNHKKLPKNKPSQPFICYRYLFTAAIIPHYSTVFFLTGGLRFNCGNDIEIDSIFVLADCTNLCSGYFATKFL